jgi:uncharacterized protein with PIN domain
MIESLGVPHCEVELMVVNNAAVDFSYLVQPDDDIHVYPNTNAHNLAPTVLLRPALKGVPRFILDQHLGRLAAYLRMMGFDTLYRNDYDDDELALVSSRENRVLLTRDVGCLKRSIVTYGYFVRETNPKLQVSEVVKRFDLLDLAAPFKHCTKCNGLLEPVTKEEVLDRVPAESAKHYDEFHRCQSCDQIYWKGSHYAQIQELIAELRNNL